MVGRLRNNLGNVIFIFLLVLIIILSLLYTKYQFDLCYPEVSDSIMYCLKHAL